MIGATVLMRGIPQLGTPPLLEIAAGTPYAVVVHDVRNVGPWSTPSAIDMNGRKRTILYHHTAGGTMERLRIGRQMVEMRAMRDQSPYGLPYNFIVMATAPYRIFYLNDVDRAWPHTYGWNHATAIAAWGNYSLYEPPAVLVRRMWLLADALAHMWGAWVPEMQHRDVVATQCPGAYLSPLLIR